jgi:hypothetical protein
MALTKLFENNPTPSPAGQFVRSRDIEYQVDIRKDVFQLELQRGKTIDFFNVFKDHTNFTLYYLSFSYYKGWAQHWIYIEDWKTTKPKDPSHAYSRQYFSNQLVSTYKDKFKCVAELNEDGRITWKTTPNLTLKRNDDGSPYTKIISIKPILTTHYHYYTVMVVEPNDHHKIRRFHLKTKDISKTILDSGWEGIHAIDTYGEARLINDTRKLLPKLPHYLNVLHGGKMTVEEEHTYNKEGKVKDISYRVLNIINRQDKNPLVKKTQCLKWSTNPTYTIVKG